MPELQEQIPAGPWKAGMPELQEQIPAGHPGAKGHADWACRPDASCHVENAHCLP
jgi:hypothetical protein